MHAVALAIYAAVMLGGSIMCAWMAIRNRSNRRANRALAKYLRQCEQRAELLPERQLER